MKLNPIAEFDGTKNNELRGLILGGFSMEDVKYNRIGRRGGSGANSCSVYCERQCE